MKWRSRITPRFGSAAIAAANRSKSSTTSSVLRGMRGNHGVVAVPLGVLRLAQQELRLPGPEQPRRRVAHDGEDEPAVRGVDPVELAVGQRVERRRPPPPPAQVDAHVARDHPARGPEAVGILALDVGDQPLQAGARRLAHRDVDRLVARQHERRPDVHRELVLPHGEDPLDHAPARAAVVELAEASPRTRRSAPRSPCGWRGVADRLDHVVARPQQRPRHRPPRSRRRSRASRSRYSSRS